MGRAAEVGSLANLSGTGPARKPLSYVVRRYDRVARFYSVLEPLFGITPMARRKAVAALRLRQRSVVLEIGAGTGRNLPHLTDAVGLTEASWPSMPHRACWPNLSLTQTRLRPLIAPLVPLLARLGPGDAYSRPWEDLADICGPVTTDQFLFGLYYVCAVAKPA
jgi:hypothetical protein